jgi:hypothetical protein
MSMEIPKDPHGRARRSGPRRVHRTDLSLPPTVVEAAVLHAKDLKMPQVEYFQSCVATYFKMCLLTPPEPAVTHCPHCGLRTREPRSAWKRIRMSTRLDPQTRQMIESLAEDYFLCNWSRAFEATVRHFLGDERNPPPEGAGKIPGVKLRPGRKTADNPPVEKPKGRPISSVEGYVRKHGGKVE